MKIWQTLMLIVLSGNSYCSEVASKDYFEVSLDGANYEFTLPLPFGQSAVSVVLSDSEIVDMTVTTEAGEVLIGEPALSALNIVGSPHVSIPYGGKHSDGPLEWFSLGFESGTEYQVTMTDVPGCPDPCVDWVTDMVRLTIYHDGNFEITVVETGKALRGPDLTN